MVVLKSLFVATPLFMASATSGSALWRLSRYDLIVLMLGLLVLFLAMVWANGRYRKRLKAQIHAAEERYRLLARATSDVIYDYRFDDQTLWWDESFSDVFGYEPGGLAPSLHEWEARIHRDDQFEVSQSLARVIDSERCDWTAEYRFLRHDGSWADVIDRAHIVRGQNGKPIRFIGGMLDVSQQSHDRRRLRLLQRALDSATAGVTISDAREPDGPTVFVNHAYTEMTGYTANELLGRNLRFLQGDDRDQEGRHQVKRLIAEEKEGTVLLRNKSKSGTEIWIELLISPVRDERGGLTHYIGIQNDVSKRIEEETSLTYRATHDALTGLPNRQLLFDRLNQALLESKRFDRDLIVMFADLDNFKLINDSLGHAAGDTYLRAVSDRLVECVRETDTVARVGGDEFVIMLVGQGGTHVGPVIERIQRWLTQPIDLDGVQHYASMSIGFARSPAHGDEPDELVKHADVAMYQAKARGKNCVVEYQPSFAEGISERLNIYSRLREAEINCEFVLHFQPQFDWNGQATGIEALLRWQHPDRGMLLPVEFLTALEESGQMASVGRWVLREAGKHHRKLCDAGLGHIRIAVNVSATQIRNGILEDLQKMLDEMEIGRGAIEIELTESTLMSSAQSVVSAMEKLAQRGVSFAIDDFGTGYSSLMYLKRLPIQRLKIDQAFVNDLGQDPDDEAICAAIVLLASTLGLETIAEGVELPQQRDWLIERGCSELQGFLLARPMPFAAALAAIKVNQSS